MDVLEKTGKKTSQPRAWKTTVFVKQLMAVSGLFFVIFLLFHSYGNLKVFYGAEAYNEYAEWLKTDAFVPIFPHGGFIIVFRILFTFFLFLHMGCAMHVSVKAKLARKTRYAVKKNTVESYAARTMMIGGIALLCLIVFHILHFTTSTITTGFEASDTPYDKVIASFSSFWVVLIYFVFVGVVAAHVGHGFWSAFQSLGWVRAQTRKAMVLLSGIIALVLFAAFMLPPFAIYFGLVT